MLCPVKNVPPVISVNLLWRVFPLKSVDHLTSVVGLTNAVHLPSVVPLRRVLFPVASVVLLTKVVPF